MDMRTQLPIVLLLTVFLTGCAGLWNFANSWSLRNDINKILAKAQIDKAQVNSLKMVGTTRAAIAEISIDKEQFDAISKALSLVETQDISSIKMHMLLYITGYEEIAASAETETEGEFLSRLYSKDPKLLFAESKTARPAQLSLGIGSGFTFLILIFDPEEKKAVLLTAYAYG